jgi:DNA-binding NtrC family response regulator
MVLEGKFREDLYYRLNVVKLILPPLKERREDIPLLMDFFFGEFAKENGVRVPLVSPEAGKILMAYEWSGNVRELKNFCERMVVLKRGGKIERSDLEEKFFSAPAGKAADSLSVKENEERLIGEALAKTRGNKSKAAALMGISRRTLHRKLKEQEK